MEVDVKIRFGIGLGADTGPEQLAGIVDHLEATGVDSLWFAELVYSKAVDPFVGMAYALARTTNLKVGTSVTVLPGRHPVLVAKQLASLSSTSRCGCSDPLSSKAMSRSLATTSRSVPSTSNRGRSSPWTSGWADPRLRRFAASASSATDRSVASSPLRKPAAA